MKDRKATFARVIAVAIDRFLAKPFHEVSVFEIATAAHCSLSAIYDMFGDKEGLYMEALAAQKKTLRAPPLESDDSVHPFKALLIRLLWWIDCAMDPAARKLLQAMSSHTDKIHNALRPDLVQPDMHWEPLRRDVDRCIEAGCFRDLEQERIVLLIAAGTVYHPHTIRTVFPDPRYWLSRSEILMMTLAPLIDESFRAMLDEHVQLLRQTEGQDSAPTPKASKAPAR